MSNKTCECTSSFVELTIHFLYTVFNIYEKGKFHYAYKLKCIEYSLIILY